MTKVGNNGFDTQLTHEGQNELEVEAKAEVPPHEVAPWLSDPIGAILQDMKDTATPLRMFDGNDPNTGRLNSVAVIVYGPQAEPFRRIVETFGAAISRHSRNYPRTAEE